MMNREHLVGVAASADDVAPFRRNLLGRLIGGALSA
jgi:hypothetical protein